MSPTEHLEWLSESVDWYLALDAAVLSQPVLRCPGWQVDTVYDHLGRGIGIARVAALRSDPDADVFAVMGAAIPPPTKGEQARAVFADALPVYLETLANLDPSSPCATYAGRGEVGFWIRRDAIELALHASDVADSLGLAYEITSERASDAIDETIEFALPRALQVLARSAPAPCRLSPNDAPDRMLGDGAEPAALLRGSAHSLLLALWGRGTVEVEGDEEAAGAWTGLIAEAFRGPAPQ